jgi:hypothetical protein
MASTTNSPRVEGTPEPGEDRPARDETRTRLFRPGAHRAPTPVDAPVDAPAREPVVVTDDRLGDHRRPEDRAVEDRVPEDAVVEPTEDVVEERRVVTKRAHTSGAAAFSLIVGVVAAYTALLVFAAPADIALGFVAVLLGLIGMRSASKVGVTGRWLAALGTLLGLGAILLGTLTMANVQTSLNDKDAVDRIQQQVDQWRNRVNDANLNDGIN